MEPNNAFAFIHSIHPIGAQAGAEWLTGFILNSDQNLKKYLATVVALLINKLPPLFLKLFPTHTVNA
jgi:hypothetical protein